MLEVDDVIYLPNVVGHCYKMSVLQYTQYNQQLMYNLGPVHMSNYHSDDDQD